MTHCWNATSPHVRLPYLVSASGRRKAGSSDRLWWRNERGLQRANALFHGEVFALSGDQGYEFQLCQAPLLGVDLCMDVCGFNCIGM